MRQIGRDSAAVLRRLWLILSWATELLARAGALCAGLVLVGLIAVIAMSVTGRALAPWGFTSIRGDYELVSAGVAVAAFLSLGWTQFQGGHAAVDLLIERFPARLRRIVAALVHLLVAVVAAFLCWRLAEGTIDRFVYKETAQLSRLPLFWPYAFASLGSGIFALTALRSGLYVFTAEGETKS